MRLAAIAIGVAQGGFAIYGSSSLSLVQSLSPARLRGRVTSLFTLLYWGLMPFGALAGGLIAERSSALVAVMLAGSMVIACGVVLFLVRPQIATLWIDRKAGTVSGTARRQRLPATGRDLTRRRRRPGHRRGANSSRRRSSQGTASSRLNPTASSDDRPRARRAKNVGGPMTEATPANDRSSDDRSPRAIFIRPSMSA